MDNQTYRLIKDLAKKEEIEEEEVVQLFITSVEKACQEADSSKKIEVVFDWEKKKFVAYQVYQIREKVSDPENEISQESPLIENQKNQVKGNCLFCPISLKKLVNYPNILQEFRFSLKKNQQKKSYQEFLPWQGKIVEGKIQEIHSHYCLVNLLNSSAIAYWPREEWLSPKILEIGQTQSFLLKEVKKNDPYTLYLTQRSEEFLRKLLEIEIPEIREKKVVVREILRQPGVISKVIVSSEIFSFNSLGACIGKEGQRIKNIKQRMGKERIDFVQWTPQQNQLIANLLFPLNVLYFCKIQKQNSLVVVVSQEELNFNSEARNQVVSLIEKHLQIKVLLQTPEEIEKKNVVILGKVSKNSWGERTSKIS